MAGEANRVFKEAVTIISNGPELSHGSVNGEIGAALGRDQHHGYPYVNCVLAIAYGTAPVEGKVIHLYQRELNISGANHATKPGLEYRHKYMGSFAVKAQTEVQYISLTRISIEESCTFYIENDTGQTISAGWSLTAQPWTWGPWI